MAVVGLHHVHLRVNDLAATRIFARDFGFVEADEIDSKVYLRGAGSPAYSVILESDGDSSLAGLAFQVDSDDDLHKATRDHGASAAQSLNGPGGGQSVSLSDPDGNMIHLVHNVAERNPDALPQSMVYNQGPDKPRLGDFQHQAVLGPPQLLRLGHVGLFVTDVATSGKWYGELLGLLPSDLMYMENEDNIVTGFYRVNRGEKWVDHHCIGFFGMGTPGLHHLSLEVQNSEAQFVAHRWLEQQGHQPIWGVGKHPKGSHVFDVWRDPSGNRFETFSDTDMLNAATPAGLISVMEAEMDLWSNRDVGDYFA